VCIATIELLNFIEVLSIVKYVAKYKLAKYAVKYIAKYELAKYVVKYKLYYRVYSTYAAKSTLLRLHYAIKFTL